ncbi:hypothetical protein HHI36_011587 [Cryptolaemus montrouzieri]|uniref:Uncharacterized protein n=1 Tax=Cryptolaemus montrouzieri TaxID=559131 RepID=A0ABD2MM96_9CUCU
MKLLSIVDLSISDIIILAQIFVTIDTKLMGLLLRGEFLLPFLNIGVTEARNHCVGSKLDLKDLLNIILKGNDRDEAQFLRTKALSPSGPGAEEVFKSSK